MTLPAATRSACCCVQNTPQNTAALWGSSGWASFEDEWGDVWGQTHSASTRCIAKNYNFARKVTAATCSQEWAPKLKTLDRKRTAPVGARQLGTNSTSSKIMAVCINLTAVRCQPVQFFYLKALYLAKYLCAALIKPLLIMVQPFIHHLCNLRMDDWINTCELWYYHRYQPIMSFW